MNTRFFLSLMVISILVFSAVNCPAEVAYTVTDLGWLGGYYSRACGINNAGQVVGYSTLDDWEYDSEGSVRHFVHAFLWENGQIRDLGTLEGEFSSANKINDSGCVVGHADVLVNYGENNHAASWYNGEITDIGALLSQYDSNACDINSTGQVVGNYYVAGLKSHAFLVDNGTVTDLGTLGTELCFAQAINDHGQVVGYDGVRHSESAFIWQNGVMSALTNLGEGFSLAYDINNSGQVVGWSQNGSFLWEEGNVTRIEIAPFAINNNGQIVGRRSGFVAHIWENGVVTDLNMLISPDSGWVLKEARDINDHGQIVGYGTYNGEERAFLLTPVPEPGSFAVLALGMTPLMLALKRKRK